MQSVSPKRGYLDRGIKMKYQGEIEFRVRNFPQEFDAFDVFIGKDDVQKIKISSQDDVLILKCVVAFEGIERVEEIDKKCKIYCEGTVGKLACFFEEAFSEVSFEVGNLVDQNGESFIYKPKRMVLRRVVGTFSLHAPVDQKKLVKFVNDSGLDKDNYCELFSFILKFDNDVQKFLFLYNMLLEFSGDKQPRVDEKIRNVYPDVSMSISEHTNKPETIYTRLRNEVGHKRSDASYMRTIGGISSNILKFQNIVKKIIFKME